MSNFQALKRDETKYTSSQMALEGFVRLRVGVQRCKFQQFDKNLHSHCSFILVSYGNKSAQKVVSGEHLFREQAHSQSSRVVSERIAINDVFEASLRESIFDGV
jgi:hypothetical protein